LPPILDLKIRVTLKISHVPSDKGQVIYLADGSDLAIDKGWSPPGLLEAGALGGVLIGCAFVVRQYREKGDDS
jgi:hypothetical protein